MSSQKKKLFNFKIYDSNMPGENMQNVKKRMFKFLKESDNFLMILVCASQDRREQDQYMEIFLRSFVAKTEAELTTWLLDDFFNYTTYKQIFLQQKAPIIAFFSVKSDRTTCRNACKSDTRPLHLRIPNRYLS
jgi:hypothetical protein